MARIKIEDISNELAADSWKILSTEYKNLDSELIFECPEGHRVYTSWGKLRVKRECPTCRQNVYKEQDTKIVAKPRGVIRILALDQATHTTGWSIFDGQKLIKYGAYKADNSDDIERYYDIKMWLLSMIANWKPDYIALEGIQFQTSVNGQSHSMGVTVFETLAHLQGILMETCYEQKVKYEICHTNTWRAACGVKGKTRTDKKRSMQLLAKKWYDVTVTDDEADAIGIGRYLAEKINKQIEVFSWE